MIPALDLRGISKRFGPVHALDGADFVLQPGEVHALLGENGAGKSTLMNIAAGILKPDRGEIVVNGVVVRPGSPREAALHGVGMVHQHFSSVPAFTAAENIALAARWPMWSPRALRSRVATLARRTGLAIDPDAPSEAAPVVLRQRIEILKVLATESTILLFDEPTGTLAPPDALELLAVLRRLAASGSSVVLITHRLEEALAHADRVTVLRRGKPVFSGPARGLSSGELASHMLGKAVDTSPPPARTFVGHVPTVVLNQLSVPAYQGRGPGLREATLEVFPGEVVGIAAVEGSGQLELLRALAGLAKPDGGTIQVGNPVAFIPEDRTTEGLIQEFSLADNLMLGFGARAPWVHHGILDRDLCRRMTADIITAYHVQTTGPLAPAASLSGGNQQRFMLGRALALEPSVVLAEQPVRGLDVQAGRAVYGQLRSAATRGAAVLLHSSDLDELFTWCDRLIVLAGGRLLTPAPGSSREEIGWMMLGPGLRDR